jgi:hypothetical protein
LSSPSRLRLFYLLHFSKPASDRLIYRAIRKQRARKIVELGIGTGERAVRVIQMASQVLEPREVHYTGIDLFEGRSASDKAGLSLREAHCLLKTTGARIQLVPGSAAEGLARTANALGQIDMLILSAQAEPDALAGVWFYVPRLLHNTSQIFMETPSAGGEPTLRRLNTAEIEGFVAATRRRAA